jgi:hypothetical protein
MGDRGRGTAGGGNKGRKPGVRNYKPDIALAAIRAKLPSGSEGWKQVAILYQQMSHEQDLRQGDDLKRYFFESLCQKGKKPTGASTMTVRVEEAQDLWERIHRNDACHDAGFHSSDSEEDDYEFEDKNGENDVDTNDTDDVLASMANASRATASFAALAARANRQVAVLLLLVTVLLLWCFFKSIYQCIN